MTGHSRKESNAKRGSSKKRRRTGTLGIVNYGLLVLYTVLAAVMIFMMYSYNFLAFRGINIIYTVAVIALFALSLFFIITKRAKKTTTVLLVLSTIILSITLYFFKTAVDVTGKMNESTSYSEIEMSIVVPKDSSIDSISQLSSVLAPTDSDGTNIQTFLDHISSSEGVTLTTEKTDSYQAAYESLINGTGQAMVMNSAYASLLELSYDNYDSNLKTIYTYTIETKNSGSSSKTTSSDVFNIYISGIDTYGSISSVSRSDVNIILTVNMKTHKILMTTTPRDSYVQIPDGGNNQYDKLTHAGIYGVETSVHTLENLYNIDIDYYARINFTSFLKLIDLLGGVTVYNDQAFTSYTNSNYTFEVGNVTLDSEKALAFVRERYSLANGDYDRGENQLKVITAIINKLTSYSAISSYSSIINGLQDSVQTNMSLKTMMKLANAQLSSGENFTITSQEVTGTGSTGELTSYAMPNASLYMISLDQSSVDSAKAAINSVMEGK